MKKTQRGFPIYSSFKDKNKSEIRIQMSSQVGGPYCWIFSDGGSVDGNSGSALLGKKEAKLIINALSKFLKEYDS